jgi:TetR/AcrR family transcriptional repressor of mexJK operon
MTVLAKGKAEATPDVKEEKILAAARGLFMVVAHRAKASKTTLYTRFPSKEALFAATISSECERRGMRFSTADFENLPVEQALQQIGRRFVDLIWSPEAVRVEQIVTAEAARFPEVAETFLREGPERVMAQVADYLASATARGFLAVEDPGLASRQFLMLLKGMPHCAMVLGLEAAPTGEARDEFVAKTVRLFLDGTRPR